MRPTARAFRRLRLGCEALSVWVPLPTWTSRSVLGLQEAGISRVEHLRAEIMAASEAAKEAVHLRLLYNELTQSEAKPTRLHLDCKAAIDTAYNPEHHSKLKHVQRRHFFIRQVAEDHQIVVPYVETDKNLADFFTKPLPARKFFELRKARMNEPNES